MSKMLKSSFLSLILIVAPQIKAASDTCHSQINLGIVSGVIKVLGLIEAIDKRLQKDTQDQENITAGEARAEMIINGLGFSDRPLSLTPQFLKQKHWKFCFAQAY